jgi:hypothetical protein
MYTDLYLKFADAAQAEAVLYTVHPAAFEEDGVTVTEAYTTPNYQNIDTIGIIYKRAPEPPPEGYEPIPDEGWHVNVRLVEGEDAEPLVQYEVHPVLPRRVWASAMPPNAG